MFRESLEIFLVRCYRRQDDFVIHVEDYLVSLCGEFGHNITERKRKYGIKKEHEKNDQPSAGGFHGVFHGWLRRKRIR